MKKFGILCLTLILALGALGVGYAHWFETVDITQSVDTGKVCIGFSKNQSGEAGEWEGKDVAQIFANGIGPIKGTVEYPQGFVPVWTSVYVLMQNAYPCYASYVLIDVANCGTIPIHIGDLVFTMVQVDPDTGEIIDTLALVWNQTPPTNLGHWISQGGTGDEVMSMAVVNLEGAQIHPGFYDSLELDFHVKQTAEQKATYILTIDITGTQWNLD
jgi:hypothetical protein